MKKIKSFTLSLMAALLAFACISCDNGISKIEKYGYKLKDEGSFFKLDYNNGIYNQIFPLKNFIDTSNLYGKELNIDLPVFADEDINTITISILYENPNGDNRQNKIALCDDVIVSGSVKFITGKIIIPLNLRETYDPDNYKLIIASELRNNESTTSGKHADFVNIYYDAEQLSISLTDTSMPIMQSLIDGRIIAETDWTGKGIKLTLNGSYDNWWSDNRWGAIFIENGIEIKYENSCLQINNTNNSYSVYYPFTRDTSGFYNVIYGDEKKEIYSCKGIGEVDFTEMEKIKLNILTEKYPIVNIDGLNYAVRESVTAKVNLQHLFVEPLVVMWGTTGDWLGAIYNYDIPYGMFDLLKYIPLSNVNNKEVWNYEYRYIIKPAYNDNYYNNCFYMWTSSSEKKDIKNVDLADEYFNLTGETFEDCHPLGKNGSKYTYITTGEEHTLYLESGNYCVEWVNKDNYTYMWNGDFLMPQEWDILSDSSYALISICSDDNLETLIDSGYGNILEFSVNTTGDYKVFITSDYGAPPSTVHGAYHIYKKY